MRKDKKKLDMITDSKLNLEKDQSWGSRKKVIFLSVPARGKGGKCLATKKKNVMLEKNSEKNVATRGGIRP